MPHSLLITYGILLVSQWTTYGRAHRLATQTIPDNDLRSSCAFELGGYGYNLCPLLEERLLVKATDHPINDDTDRGEGSSSGSKFYYVALGGMRGDSGYSGQGSECDEDTWVCLRGVEKNGKDRPIASRLKASDKTGNSRRRRRPYTLKSTASIEIADEDTVTSPSRPLQLSLYGAEFKRTRQVAQITFLCSDEESLRYVSEDKGVHSFIWATSHGCPVRLSRTTSLHLVANEEPANDSEGEGTEEKEKNEGDGDLLPSNPNKARKWIAITVVILFALVCTCVLLLSTRARSLATENLKGATYTIIPLLSRAVIKLQPIGSSLNNLTKKSIVSLGSRFRQGDSRLVQWAQEDMSLEDSEDMMVNGAGAFDRDELWNTEASGEYIPLTISPQYGHSRRTRSYGATPDVETFAERGAVSGFAKLFGR